jgi:hypothetical protein
MAQLVKYKSRDEKYVNLGIKLASGFIVPIRNVVPKHYYQLVENATEIKIEYKAKGDKK